MSTEPIDYDESDPETMTRDTLVTQLRSARRACRTLGSILERQGRDALAASGREDLIDKDGDGDWELVWETLRRLRPECDRLRTALADRDRELADLKRPAGEDADQRVELGRITVTSYIDEDADGGMSIATTHSDLGLSQALGMLEFSKASIWDDFHGRGDGA